MKELLLPSEAQKEFSRSWREFPGLCWRWSSIRSISCLDIKIEDWTFTYRVILFTATVTNTNHSFCDMFTCI